MAALAQKATAAKRKFELLSGASAAICGIGLVHETAAVQAQANPHKM
ncbi:hypothetical protein HMPREF0972_02473 [Actinomyces sp. oral taxon 848 str. F0332]|nr:hypothetical protein HMPREF0972_02473 [Actinomyces sp. oral taxon 848 str. F0332]